MTLYEIDEQIRLLEDYGIDGETGEILSDEEFAKKFDEIQMALDDKIENTLKFVKNLESFANDIKAEEDALKKRRIQKEKLAEKLKNNIDRYVRYKFTDEEGNLDTKGLNKFKFERPSCYLGYRKSSKVQINDMNKIPKEFINIKTEEKVDSLKLKKWLKDNKCKGAEIVENYNMQVK